MIAQSLLDFILSLLHDQEVQQEFQDDPGNTLARHGFQDLCAQDVADVLPLVIDNSRVSLDRSYEMGGNTHTMVVPPPPAPHPMPGESGMHAVVRQFDYITNTYVYNDSHDTLLDNSVNQNIWAHGDVFQLFDNDPVIASGDGAVAAGDDVDKVNTGDHNANSFGSGDAYHVDDVNADHGSAVAVGGNVTGLNDDNSTNPDINNFGSGEVNVAGTNGNATQNDTDSHATVGSYNDVNSHNDVDTDVNSNNDIASHNDVDADVNSNNDIDTDVNSNNDIDTDVNSNNDIASHNDVDADVNSNNDTTTHTDVASHNLVIVP